MARIRSNTSIRKQLSLFETALSVPAEEIEFLLRGTTLVPWAEYVLNPRRLRGSDFLMRWSQGRWSEERVVQAVADTGQYFALPYGPSGTAPEGDVQAFELYFERLERAGLGKMKRPDLLIMRTDDQSEVYKIVEKIGGLNELPFTPENDPRMTQLIAKSVVALECENSLWIAKKMPQYGVELTPQKRLGGKLGLKKRAVVPTVILKEEDREPLKRWQHDHRIPVHIWQVFYDMAFGIALDKAEELIRSGAIEETKQVFQAPGGATTRKSIYKIYYHYCYCVGEAVEEPSLLAASITDKNGHILPYVKFQGGRLALSQETLRMLNKLSKAR